MIIDIMGHRPTLSRQEPGGAQSLDRLRPQRSGPVTLLLSNQSTSCLSTRHPTDDLVLTSAAVPPSASSPALVCVPQSHANDIQTQNETISSRVVTNCPP
jgi:hypothetical protein